MKTVKIIISLLAVLLFCAVLTACADEDKEQPKQNAVQVAEADQKEKVQEPKDDDGLASREQKAREQSDSNDEDDRIDTPKKDDDGLAEREQEAREQQEQAEQERERREQEEREREEQERREQEQQQSNGYEHHIGNAVFYTEHDLWKYIFPNPRYPEYSIIDLEAMLRDIWGDIGVLQVNNGYAGTDGSSFNLTVGYGYVDGNSDDYSHNEGGAYYIIVTGEQYTSRVIIDEERPPGGWIIIKGDGFGLSSDTAALLLYLLEQAQSNPRSNIAGELPLPSNYECSY